MAQTSLRHVQVAHARQRTESQRGTRQEQRTDEDVPRAEVSAHLREVLEEVCHPGSTTRARSHDALGLRTAFETNVENEWAAQGMSRERGALGVAVQACPILYLHRLPKRRLQQHQTTRG